MHSFGRANFQHRTLRWQLQIFIHALRFLVYLLIYDRDLILKKAKPILHKKEEGATQQ